MHSQITPLLLTFNEEANLERTLASLQWAGKIVVVDSGSTDRTLDILAAHPAAIVVHRSFDTFAAQCNFGLARIETPWVLSLDADYVLTAALVEEIAALHPGPEVSGYRAAFRYCIHGQPLRGTLYPPRTVLYRVAGAAYEDVGHSHRVRLPGEVRMLQGAILHDDRKPLDRWLDAQRRYARKEAAFLDTTAQSQLSRNDRIRRTGWIAPIVILPYTLLIKGCLFDGWPGWIYALQRAYAEALIALAVLERRFAGPPPDGHR